MVDPSFDGNFAKDKNIDFLEEKLLNVKEIITWIDLHLMSQIVWKTRLHIYIARNLKKNLGVAGKCSFYPHSFHATISK